VYIPPGRVTTGIHVCYILPVVVATDYTHAGYEHPEGTVTGQLLLIRSWIELNFEYSTPLTYRQRVGVCGVSPKILQIKSQGNTIHEVYIAVM
jgi:hypothetical protein